MQGHAALCAFGSPDRCMYSNALIFLAMFCAVNTFTNYYCRFSPVYFPPDNTLLLKTRNRLIQYMYIHYRSILLAKN